MAFSDRAKALNALARWTMVVVLLHAGRLPSPAQDAPAPKPAAPPAAEPPEVTAESLEDPFELTAAQRARLSKYLPNALPDLELRKAPFHIVALGDSVTRYTSHDEHEGDTHRSYLGVFAAELAKLFFYTGGVRVIAPEPGQPAKALDAAGPEITIENMAIGGRISMHALGRVTTDAFANKPKILTINEGINDALARVNLATYLRAFELAAELARANGCDPIFFEPSTTLSEGQSLAGESRTLVYASALEDLAERLGILYFDLGAVTAEGRGISADLSDADAIAAYNQSLIPNYQVKPNGEIDPLHPSEECQRRMGKAAYKALLEEPAKKYRVSGAVTLDGAGGFEASFKLKNLSDAPAKGRVFPMPFEGFEPEQTAVPFELKPGKGIVLTARYRSSDGDNIYDLHGAEPLLRVPLLIADEKRSAPVALVAPYPLVPIWKLGATDGLRSTVGGEFTVAVPDPAGLSGSYRATWGGEESAGNFRSGTPTGFSFPLPAGGTLRKRDDLTLDLVAAGKTYRFARGLEVARNIGLDQAIPLLRADSYDAGARSGVTFRASANEQGITLVYEIGVRLKSFPAKARYYVEVHIDARQYGKRRSFGFTDLLRLIPLDDGTVKVSALRPGQFGNGYDRPLDRAAVQCQRQALPGGGERLSVTLPRSFFYLHEWAIGNGNSLLGINTTVYTQSGSATADYPYPPDGIYQLVDPARMTPFNAESLAVLELTAQPTKRWNSRLY